jgi:hypothetical protein
LEVQRANEDRAALPVPDIERDRAVAALRAHCGEGRLTLDEFAERVEVVLAAAHLSDLDRALVDLPSATAVPASPPAALDGGPVRGGGFIVSIFGSSCREGSWRPRRSTTLVSIMGSCRLDLRQALLSDLDIAIRAFTVMGSVDIIVPEGVDARLSGFSIFGSKSIKVHADPRLTGSPVVRVSAASLMGSVKVRSKRRRLGGAPSRRSIAEG